MVLTYSLPSSQSVLLFTEMSHHIYYPTEAGGQVNLKDCSAYIVLQLKMVLIISKSVDHILQHNAYKL